MAFGFGRRAAREVDMLNGPLFRSVIIYTVPIMLSGLLQLMFNAADVAVVGRFAGDNALAAVGSTTSLCSLITNLFIGLSVGANVVCAKALGASDAGAASRAVHTSMLLALICGAALTLLGVTCAGTFLRWMGSPDGVIQLATVYLRIYFLGMIPSMIYNFGSALVRSAGDTSSPFTYLLLAGALNLALNLFFVAACGMDVDGVALATVISQCLSAVLIVRRLMLMEGALKLDMMKLRLHPDSMRQIASVGLPAGLQSMVSAGSNVLIQSTINSFGAVVVAGNSAASNLCSFVHMAMSAFYQSAISFSSQNCGAGKYTRIWKLLYTVYGCVAVIGVIGGVGMWISGGTLLYIFTDSAEVVAAGMVLIAYQCIPFAICGLLDSTIGCIRGMGSSLVTMLITSAGICGFRIAWIFVLKHIPGLEWGIEHVYLSYPVSWAVTYAAQLAYFIYLMKRLERGAA